MNSQKAAQNMLNASLILHGVYAVLFMVGYVFQKPLWRIFGVTPEIMQMKPIISPAIVIAVVVTFALSAWLNFTLRKKSVGAVSTTLGVLTAIFSVCAFWANIITKSVTQIYYSVIVGVQNGADYVVLAGVHGSSVSLLDDYLLVFFAAGLALLPCAYCVMRFGEKENNNSKG